jgi:metal-dependent amidase/aminoacylase/carboxypeptidase family protein
MAEVGCDLDRMTSIRHCLHQNAETAFLEHNTHAKIKETLISYGIEESSIKVLAGTGMIVDIHGTQEGGEEGKQEEEITCIMLRADMDALPMPENNPTLAYRT